MDASRFLTTSLLSSPLGDRITRIAAAALQSVEPGAALARYVQRKGDQLFIGEHLFPLPLNRLNRILVVGAGKAAIPMTKVVSEILGDYLGGGIILTKKGSASARTCGSESKIILIEAGHPIPDERGLAGARLISDLLTNTRSDDLVICLISGGASAMLVLPVEGITLTDLQDLTGVLLACGANIIEINTLRKHLEQLKGGQLARLASPAQIVGLLLSDVVGDSQEVIGSGPTVPDPTSFCDAYAVLERYDILGRIPPSILQHILRGMRGETPETPKPGDSLFENVLNQVIGSNQQAAEAALVQAQVEGFNSLLLTTSLQGEARQASPWLASITRQLAIHDQPVPRPACLIVGGETTVTVRGNGLGGRNQELALAAVQELTGLPNVVLVAMSTDGCDGPCDAAGAVVTGDTLKHAQNLGMHPADYLARNDAYHFFEPLGDLLKPGPTLTNVNDLVFLFAF